MDPQITNLVPVLKSYWLVIHVATITASYGFLAMGALAGVYQFIADDHCKPQEPANTIQLTLHGTYQYY